MNVDINILRVYFKVEEVRHLFSLRNQTVEGRHHRLIEVRMLHISAIDEEELVNTLLAGSLRLANETGNLTHGGFYIHRQQLMIEALAENIQDALPEIGSTEIENLRLIAAQREVDLRIHQGYTLKSGKDIIQLGRIRFQELPSCGYIIEYIIDGEDTSHRTGARFLFLETGTGNPYQGSYFIRSLTGLEFYLCYGSDGSQSLTTEAHRMKIEQIISLADLGSGMALESQAGIRLRHSLTIIYHLNTGTTSIHHYDLDIHRSGINGILYQFLDDGGWALYHLTSRYLIGYRIG